MSFTDKVVLVTGASRGIGRAIAETFAARGAKVVGTATSESGAEAISAYLGEQGCGMALNVTSQESIETVFAAIKARFGDIDILINNAGITRDNLFMRMKDEEWEAVLDVNLTAAFRLSRAALRGMMKRRYGRIIGISSVVGATGNPGQGNYAAAKAGLVGMTKALAAEVATRGITVNCIAPGFITSAMTDALNEKQRETILTRVPAGRLGTGAEIGAAAVYLASEEAGYVTGQTLHVNGGMAMY